MLKPTTVGQDFSYNSGTGPFTGPRALILRTRVPHLPGLLKKIRVGNPAEQSRGGEMKCRGSPEFFFVGAAGVDEESTNQKKHQLGGQRLWSDLSSIVMASIAC